MEERWHDDMEDDCKRDLLRELGRIEEEREEIAKEMRAVDADTELFDEVQRDVRGIFKEIWKYCEEDLFLAQTEELEEEIWECGREDERGLEEKRERLEERKRKSYDTEDEIREELRRRQMETDNEEKE